MFSNLIFISFLYNTKNNIWVFLSFIQLLQILLIGRRTKQLREQ